MNVNMKEEVCRRKQELMEGRHAMTPTAMTAYEVGSMK
jgi:hypothetical protein